MKRILMLGVLLVALSVSGYAQKKPYKVVFYNLENFFDTQNDPDVLDDEFTPDGPKKWTQDKYDKKLHNIEKVFFDIAAINKDYPAVIGVCEVENRNVLEDIVATQKLAPANYRIVHYDSPEARGVDAAFIYRPDVLKLEGSKAIRTVIPSLPDFKTRDIVTMWGKISCLWWHTGLHDWEEKRLPNSSVWQWDGRCAKLQILSVPCVLLRKWS